MPLWTPADIQTAIWLDANDASTITLNGSTVSQWADKSGSLINVSQSNAALQPTYNATALNGKPALVWPDVGNSRLMKTAFEVNTRDVFVVARYRDGTQSTFAVELQGVFGVGSSIGLIGLAPNKWYSPSSFPQFRLNGGTQQSLTNSITALPLPPSVLNSTAPTAAVPGIFALGNDREVGGRGWSGLISEVIVLSSIASTDTRQRIEGYLAWKWGFQASLPANHPYKNTAPYTELVVPVVVPNAPNGARYRVWNTTRNVEIANAVVSGGAGILTTFVADDGTSPHVQGDSVTVDITYPVSTTAYLPSRLLGQVTTNGVSGFVSQINDEVYNFHGINGSTITKFSADFAQDDIEVAIAENFLGAELYAFYVYMLVTESGIREWLGAITAIDNANFRINVGVLPLRFDNQTSLEVWQTDNVRVFRSDSARPVRHPTTGGGGIDLNWRSQVYTTIVSTASPVITGDISQVPAAVQSGMTAQGYTSARAGNIDRLDVAVSTRTQSGSTISANITQVNGIGIDGVGTAENPWGPV